MTAPGAPAEGSVELARRLKDLRKDRSIPQRGAAEALGVSVALISAWESETNPAAPLDGRIRELATFYASQQSWTGEHGRLLTDDELTPAERETRDQLVVELRTAPGHPPRSAALSRAAMDSGSSLRFPPGQDIRVVCGMLDDLQTLGHPYTKPENLNYTDLLTFADIDALIELIGFLRKVNPDSDVRFVRSDRLGAGAESADTLSSHLILLGGVGLNALTESMLGRAELPIRQTEHPKFKNQGEVFELTAGPRKTEQFLPTVQAGVLAEDVGLFAQAPNPNNSRRTLTIFNGVFARGVLGAVRTLTDDKLRGQNEDYLAGHLTDTNRFAILMRVPVLVGNAQTPDLQNAPTRLYEWHGDAVSKKDTSSGQEKAG